MADFKPPTASTGNIGPPIGPPMKPQFQVCHVSRILENQIVFNSNCPKLGYTV